MVLLKLKQNDEKENSANNDELNCCKRNIAYLKITFQKYKLLLPRNLATKNRQLYTIFDLRLNIFSEHTNLLRFKTFVNKTSIM